MMKTSTAVLPSLLCLLLSSFTLAAPSPSLLEKRTIGCKGKNYFGYTHYDLYNAGDCNNLKSTLSKAGIAVTSWYCSYNYANFNAPLGMASEIENSLPMDETHLWQCDVQLYGESPPE